MQALLVFVKNVQSQFQAVFDLNIVVETDVMESRYRCDNVCTFGQLLYCQVADLEDSHVADQLLITLFLIQVYNLQHVWEI